MWQLLQRFFFYLILERIGGAFPAWLEVPAAVIVAQFVSLYQQIKQNSSWEGKWRKKSMKDY